MITFAWSPCGASNRARPGRKRWWWRCPWSRWPGASARPAPTAGPSRKRVIAKAADHGVVAGYARRSLSGTRLQQQARGLLPVLALFAGAHRVVAADPAPRWLRGPPLQQQVRGAFPLLALRAGADRGVVADHAWRQLGASRFQQQARSLLPLLALRAGDEHVRLESGAPHFRPGPALTEYVFSRSCSCSRLAPARLSASSRSCCFSKASCNECRAASHC